jgi:predicted glycogen debranching enzyme
MPPAPTLPTLPTSRHRTTQARPDPLFTEWLLTNGLGGFALGSVAGINTRRYHALLVASLRPPLERIVALSAIADAVTLEPDMSDARTLPLSEFHFSSADTRPLTPPLPADFEKTDHARWTYHADHPKGPVRITKTVELLEHRSAVCVSYTVDAPVPTRVTLRPLVALRDFHHFLEAADLKDRYTVTTTTTPANLPRVDIAQPHATLTLHAQGAAYHDDPQTWANFEYAWELKRGMHATEHLFNPGLFTADRPASDTTPIALFAEIGATDDPDPFASLPKARAARTARLANLCQATLTHTGPRTTDEDADALRRLALAADDFIVRRGPADNPLPTLSTILAGYPWFGDWGRDTMISLPGLLLTTGRHAEALAALRAFADARHNGLIPNLFDDYAGPAHYNTVDAPLWFLHAAAEYRRAANDHAGYADHLAPACLDIIDHYTRGTDYDIRLDPADSLITAGNPESQLTWMDARRDGVTFTPRHGKAVEINALWHHGLLTTAEAIEQDDSQTAAHLRTRAAETAASFRKFINPKGGLYDRLEPARSDWRPSEEIRPNQVFAASLRHSPLDTKTRQSVVDTIAAHLLTPHGLRTLAPGSKGYVPRLRGDMFERDKAYHNGTVWPWLLGPFAEATLRAGDFSPQAINAARTALAPLLNTLRTETTGQLAEIYDAEDTKTNPQRPDGCPAQAWSVAETLRVLAMITRRTD